MFGASMNKPAGGGLFGSSLGTNTQQPSTGGLFGNLGQNNQQNQQQGGGSLFGGLGQNQQSQPQQSGGLFGGFGQSTQTQPQQTGGLFGGLGQNTQQNQTSSQSLFGQPAKPQQSTFGNFGAFGQQNQAQQQPGGGLFSTGAFGQSNQQPQQQQQQQQQQQAPSLFGGSTQYSQSTQQQVPKLGQSQALWQPNSSFSAREKSIPEQIMTVVEKWDTNSPNCAFKHYFYNKVDDHLIPYYRPGPNEDAKAWEDALQNKPGPGFIPVLCTGFAQMGERIKLQQQNLATFNAKLHEINDALTNMMQKHETQTSIRAMDARRKHIVLKQRCLALATKVQVMRNRGYALGGDEEDLRSKLLSLEKGINDPGLGARGEEIWTRMVQVQRHAEILKTEIERSGAEAPDMLDEEMTRRAKKILEDYNTQLIHLKSEIDKIQKEYVEWEKENGGALPKPRETKQDTQGSSLRFI